MRFICWILFFTLLSCSNKSRQERKELRNLYSQKLYTQANDVLEKSEIKKDAKSQVLYLMEKGSLSYAQGQFLEATKAWEAARKLIEDYYTKSLSQKIATVLLNDKFENYYGESFEISMLYYNLTMAYYQIWLRKSVFELAPKGELVSKDLSVNEARKFLFAARASVLAWDTFFQTLQRSGTETLYLSDLIVKTLGAIIHEEIGGTDRQIAIQLYQDALTNLYSLAPAYSSFNIKYEEFINKADRKTLRRTSAPTKYFVATPAFEKTQKFLKERLKYVLLTTRKSLYSNLEKRYSLAKITKRKPSRSLLIESGLIQEKEAKVVNLGLKGLIDQVEDPSTKKLIAAIGIPLLSYFAMNTLGLVPKDRAMSYGEFVYARTTGDFVATQIAIEFEVPMVQLKPVIPPKLMVDGKEQELALIHPVSDLARMALEESAMRRLTKVGVRVGIKYIVAIVAAYKVYQSQKENNPFAGTLVAAQFFLSTKAILASEAADLRYWSLLPAQLYWADLGASSTDQNIVLEFDAQKKLEFTYPAGQEFFTYKAF